MLIMLKQELINIIQNYINDELLNIKEYNEIKEFIIKNDGKTISKRAKLPENYVWDERYGMLHINNVITKKSHLIAHRGSFQPQIQFSLAKFEDHDACHGRAAQERIDKLNDVLTNEDKLNDLLQKVNNLKATYKAFIMAFKELNPMNSQYSSFKFPAYYGVIKTIIPDNVYNIWDELK